MAVTGDRLLRIGDLSRKAGVSTQAIRYYERIGLLDLPLRSESGYRLYTDDHVDRMGFIKKAKLLDLSLAEIGELITLSSEGIRPCEHLMDLVKRRLDELDRRIEEMVALRAELAGRYDRMGAPEVGRVCGSICDIIESQADDAAKHARDAYPGALSV